jgi:hypothetical protein
VSTRPAAALSGRRRGPPQRARRGSLWIGMAIALIASGALFFHLGSKCLWGDEVVTLYYSSSLARTVSDLRHPPLYYVLVYLWARIVGPHEGALKALSACCGLATVVLTMWAGRRVGSPGVAWRAGLLAATSPLLLLYSRMLRAYALTTALGLAATVCLVVGMERPSTRRVWVGYGLAMLALVYADYTAAASLLLAHVIALLWLARGLRNQWRQLWRAWAYALMGVVVGSLPVVVGLLWHLQRGDQRGGLPAELAQAPLGVAVKLAYPLVTFATGETIGLWRWWLIAPTTAIYGGLLVVAFRAREWRAKVAGRAYGAALASILAGNAGILSLSGLATHIPISHASRLALAALPYFLVLAAVGIARIRGRTYRGVVLAILLLVNGIAVGNYFRGREFQNPNWDLPWREVAGYVRSQASPGEVIVTFEYPFLYYYYGAAPGFPDLLRAWPHWRENTPVVRRGIIVWAMPRRPTREQLAPYLRAPGVWLVRRDRGSTAERRSAQTTRDMLVAHFARVEEQGFAPVDPAAARLRASLLSRAAWPSAIMVDHFVAPRSAPVSAPPEARGAALPSGCSAVTVSDLASLRSPSSLPPGPAAHPQPTRGEPRVGIVAPSQAHLCR